MMANQSILLVIRRMWEYFTVPPPGDLGFTYEEHDPVGEFLEQQNRGAGLIEAETETEEVLPMNNFKPETEGSQITADRSLSPVEVFEAEPTTSPSESGSEVLPPTAESSQNEAEDEVIQEMTVQETNQAETGISSQLDDITLDEAEDKAAEGTGAEGNQGGTDDLLDIFRNEKEVKETDALHENLADIDIQDLLEESKDLLADINARRYRKT